MRILWLCNMIPGIVQKQLGGMRSGGLWVDHVLQGLMETSNLSMRILSLGLTDTSGVVDERVSYALFTEKLPYRYYPELEARFRQELTQFQPDVIHIWGTEYGHTLAMVNAAESCGLSDRIAVSIQGLCSYAARHYAEGLPFGARYGFSFRDALRLDNVAFQQNKFVRRGSLEIQALQRVKHVIGRTFWDFSCTSQINANRTYHFCNETLRDAFYDGCWDYASCVRHRIFISSCSYPIKGFHYLLEAFAQVRKVYPDATICVPGKSFLERSLRSTGYEIYLSKLTRKLQAEDRISFLGALDAEQMKTEYLRSNVFVLPSTVENSPNSLGEAMLLGVPCIAADVGGVNSLMENREEGIVYQSTASYLLAQHIIDVFSMEHEAAEMGRRAAAHARKTHDPEENLSRLLKIYGEIITE